MSRVMPKWYRPLAELVFNIPLKMPVNLKHYAKLIDTISLYPYPSFFIDARYKKQHLNLNLLPHNHEKAKRSIIFTHHCYYNFYYLAMALRRRGWDALSINMEDPAGKHSQLYHGEDANIFDADPEQYLNNMFSLHHIIKTRFKMMHFYGMGNISFFRNSLSKRLVNLPWDYLDLKRSGVKIGYTITGCHDMTSKTSFNTWTNGKCSYCYLNDKPEACNDQLNLEWGYKINSIADLICLETDPPFDYRNSKKSFLEPLTMAIDHEVWHPDIVIPDQYKIKKTPGEVWIYHGVGNFQARTVNGKNFKGSDIVFNVIESLKKKGYPIKLLFVETVPSIEMKYIQAQADIVIDQLHYGRYGANARECMMLGKPVISHIDFSESDKLPLSACIKETAIIPSDGSNLETILIDLINNPEKRAELGKKSRQHAIKWWSADVCAERFEKVYDALMQGVAPGEIAI